MIRNVANDSRFPWLIALLLIVGAAGALWYFFKTADLPAPTPVVTEPAPAEIEPDLPRYPMPEPAEPQQDVRVLTPLPSIEDGDAYFKMSLLEVFGEGMGELLAKEPLIEKFVTTMDNLTSSHISNRVRPIGPVAGRFAVVDLDDDQKYHLSESNFRRYDFLVDIFTNADHDAIFEIYQRFYPLLQEAFIGLGYPEGYLNDRVVEVIDHLLDTPEVASPIQLVRPHVLYEFSAPEIEALSSGQKMLLRMGSDHAARVKQTLRQFRTRIAGS